VIGEIKSILQKSAEKRSSGENILEPKKKQLMTRVDQLDRLRASLELET
jgi:hypothetical protein